MSKQKPKEKQSAFYNANYVLRLIVKLFVLFWAVVMISFGTYMIFIDPASISGAAATAYATLIGILSVAIGFLIRNEDIININH